MDFNQNNDKFNERNFNRFIRTSNKIKYQFTKNKIYLLTVQHRFFFLSFFFFLTDLSKYQQFSRKNKICRVQCHRRNCDISDINFR